MSRGVFVLGMHRSGTSAATRLVNLLGVPLCGEGDLLSGTADNPGGYWESRSLTALNDRILAAFDSDWSCPPDLAPSWEEDAALDELRAEASALFARLVPTEQWVWKDPRNCITLPFWLACLGSESAVAVIVNRNPLEIASSLAARDGLGEVYSLALWERYLRSCLSAVLRMPTLVTSYDQILDNPRAWCEETREFLGREGVETVELDQDALSYVDASLRHALFVPEAFVDHAAVSGAQRALFASLDGLRGTHRALPAPTLPVETATTEALLAERRRHYPQAREHRELGEYSHSLGEQFLELQRYSDTLGSQFVELQRNSEDLWRQFQELQRYSDDLGQRFLALEAYARELQARQS